MFRLALFHCFCCIVFGPTGIALAQAVKPLPDGKIGEIRVEHHWIAMRDGVRLSAYLFFPPGKGPWPVLMEQRYASFRSKGARRRYAQLAAGEYVVAAVNFRGTQASEGTYVGYRALQWGEKRDGFDTVEWLAKQPWSTGKIGTVGGSQGGYAQNYLAVTQPPHLVCQFMRDTGLSLFQEGYRLGGTTRPNRFQRMAAHCRVAEHNRLMLEEWFRHPDYDDYWRAEDASLHFDKMNVPCLTLGSWYDFMNNGSIESYIGRQHSGGENSRGKQKLVIGPWLHGGAKGNVIGELTYPKNAAFDINAETLRWADYWLKGKQNRVQDLPNVRYYVMGAVGEEGAPGNTWRAAADFPIPVQERSYYLHPEAALRTEPAENPESATKFLADPLNPATVPNASFAGARDARPFERQDEVRTFTTDVLTAPVEWTGKVKAEMFLSSTARDTDLIVRVSDVYPDGRSILIVDFIRRARYREGFDRQVLLTPGKVAKVAFDVGWMSQIFNKGHRIRVTIASTAAPYYEPNPNTGEPLTIEFPKNAMVATNHVHHDRRFRSRVIAPIPKTTN